jgi:hypothetical protein
VCTVVDGRFAALNVMKMRELFYSDLKEYLAYVTETDLTNDVFILTLQHAVPVHLITLWTQNCHLRSFRTVLCI